MAMKERRGIRRWLGNAASVAGLALAVLTAPASGSSPAAVGIEEFKFTPGVIAIPVGTTVLWINHDEETHTVTSATGAFGSTGLGHEETFAQTFTSRGTYRYFCALHPYMKATVVVE